MKTILKILPLAIMGYFTFKIRTFIQKAKKIKPTQNKDWRLDQDKLASIKIKDNLITVKNVRNCHYKKTGSNEVIMPKWYNKKFDLNKLKQGWFIVSHFYWMQGVAHACMSFEFENNEFITLSIEARREKNEKYDPIRALFNKNEIIYIFADERDILKVKACIRNEDVYMYPINADLNVIRKLFLEMIRAAERLNQKPIFYNTYKRSCATDLVRMIHRVSTIKIPSSFKVFLPGYSDEVAYSLGLIPHDLPFKQIKQKYRITDKIIKHQNSKNFSQLIRQFD